MNIYGDDIDSLLGNDDLNKNINENDIPDDQENENDVNDDQIPGTVTKVEPKKRQIRNPQLRLNVERLKGVRGIHTIEEYFTDMKFQGKHKEKEDLNNTLKRLEHWAHRLYPKYNFNDFLTVTERLGKKKQIQTYMNQYRQGLLELVLTNREPSDDEQDNDAPEPIDEFDDLIGQQIEKYKTAPPKTPAHETTFDSVRSSIIGTPKFMAHNPVEASTPMSDIHPLEQTPKQVIAPLSAEQMAKIAESRRLAQERLKATREAMMAQQFQNGN